MASPGLSGQVPARIVYVQTNHSLSSRYWDGIRSEVIYGTSYRYSDAGPMDASIAMCAGTNDFLYLLTVENRVINLRRYTPDPNRDRTDPDYDWNARSADDMWPVLGPATTNAVVVSELQAVWIGDDSTPVLLVVWCNGTALWYTMLDVTSMTAVQGPQALTFNTDGVYKDIRIIPENGSATIFARYKTFDIHELRAFKVTVAAGNVTDSDGDGLDDAQELAIIDADTNGVYNTVADVNGADDFDGDGQTNAEEINQGTDPADPNSYLRHDGVQVEAAARLAREDGGFAGRFEISRAASDPATAGLSVSFALSGSAAEGADYAAVTHSVTIPVSNRTASVTIAPIADNIPEGTETVSLTITAGTGYVIGSCSNATVIIKDAPYDNWRNTVFTIVQLSNPAVSGDRADLDGDGWPNSMEYAMGTDPLHADPAFRLYFDANRNLEIHYTRSHDTPNDTTLHVIQSTNLIANSWDDITPQMPCLNIEATPTVDEITLGMPSSTNFTTNAFYRLMLRRN
jgi:hypothetical protein